MIRATSSEMVIPRKPRHKRLHYGGDTDDAKVRTKREASAKRDNPEANGVGEVVTPQESHSHASLVSQECQMVVMLSES